MLNFRLKSRPPLNLQGNYAYFHTKSHTYNFVCNKRVLSPLYLQPYLTLIYFSGIELMPNYVHMLPKTFYINLSSLQFKNENEET